MTTTTTKPKHMSNEELKLAYSDRLQEPLAVHDVIHCNHRPHPYMVGSRHVVHASDHCGGMLGEETMRRIPCAWRSPGTGSKGCTTDYEGHTADRVLVLKLTRNVTQEEVKAQLTKDFGAAMEADGLDGLVFLKQEGCTIGAVQGDSQQPQKVASTGSTVKL